MFMSSKTADLDALRDDVAQLREDLKALMGTVSALGHDIAGAAGNRTHRLVDDLEKRASKSYDRISDRISDEASRYTNVVEKQIAEHPFGSAALALAVGLIISRVLDRSPSR